MNPENIDLVRRSIFDLLPEADRAADAFLKLLVLSAPRWRKVVGTPGDARRFDARRFDARRFGLLAGFVFVIEALDDLPVMRNGLGAVGIHCQAAGIGEVEHDAFRAALLEVLAEFLGPRWTPELAAAWAETHAALVAMAEERAGQERVAA